MGKTFKMSFKEKVLRKWTVGLNINDSEKNWTPGAHLPQPWGIIHVYYHNIQTSSPLNAWPIKAKFHVKHLLNGGINVYINNQGHMTKMAAMPIYGINPSKIFFSGTGGPISKKLGMKYR